MSSTTFICDTRKIMIEATHYEGANGNDHPMLRGKVFVTLRCDGSDVSFHLSPEQARSLELSIGDCLRDREAVLHGAYGDDDTIDIESADAVDARIRAGMTDEDRRRCQEIAGGSMNDV